MPLPARLTVLAAKTTGGASLLAFVVFVLYGPVRVVQLASTPASALLLDGLLCGAFFVQHSGMVRRSFQDRIARFVPRPYIPAIYAIASGLALGVLLVAWHPTGLVIASAGGPFRWAVRSLAVVAVVEFVIVNFFKDNHLQTPQQIANTINHSLKLAGVECGI